MTGFTRLKCTKRNTELTEVRQTDRKNAYADEHISERTVPD